MIFRGVLFSQFHTLSLIDSKCYCVVYLYDCLYMNESGNINYKTKALQTSTFNLETLIET